MTPPGQKFDQGKSPIHRGLLAYFPAALEQVAQVSAFGAEKYAWGDWEHVPDGTQRYLDALGRHVLQPGCDPDSGLAHLAHVAWNALAALELRLREDSKA